MSSHNIFVYKYFHNILLPKGVIDQMSNLFKVWQDLMINSTIFHKELFKDWLTPHLLDCGWYLECPKNSMPAFDVVL